MKDKRDEEEKLESKKKKYLKVTDRNLKSLHWKITLIRFCYMYFKWKVGQRCKKWSWDFKKKGMVLVYIKAESNNTNFNLKLVTTYIYALFDGIQMRKKWEENKCG